MPPHVLHSIHPQMKNYNGFTHHALSESHVFFTGQLPNDLLPDDAGFQILWSLHPAEYHWIKIHGRLVQTPRHQTAYERDYHYTGRVNKALPAPDTVKPFLDWGKTLIDARLNGILVNWYDGKLGHYIGAHRDSRTNMIVGAPIVTISLGEARVFRLRPWKATGFRDFPATNGSVFIEPFNTNLAWTHEVPHAARFHGRRISVTLRAFEK